MPLRCRRSIRLLPFTRLNIGKRGASVSVGGCGAHVTLGHGQVRETVGLPGTGLSYAHVEGSRQAQGNAPGAVQAPADQRHISIAKLLPLAGLVAMLIYFLWSHGPQ